MRCIHEEYDSKLEHQHSAKDDSLLSEPPPFFPDIFGEPTIHGFTCASPSMDTPIVDHSLDTQMSLHHLTIERINYSLKIHLTFHMLFSEAQRVNFSASHLPLYLIHQILRMSMKSLIFFIVAIVIYLLMYLIMMMILSQLIFLSLLFMMIYLLTKSKPPRLSRHFSPS